MELVHWQLTFLISLLIPSITSFNCAHGPPGIYCTHDLMGYHNCTRDNQHKIESCPNGTRCKCFIESKCPDEDPCVKYRAPQTPPGSFTMYFQGEEQTTSPIGTSVMELEGVWVRDAERGMMMKRVFNMAPKWRMGNMPFDVRFEIVLPRSDGRFDKVGTNINFAYIWGIWSH